MLRVSYSVYLSQQLFQRQRWHIAETLELLLNLQASCGVDPGNATTSDPLAGVEPSVPGAAGLMVCLLLNGMKRLLFSARQSTASAMMFSISWITVASPVLELCVAVSGKPFGMALLSSKGVAGDSGAILSGVFHNGTADWEVDSGVITGIWIPIVFSVRSSTPLGLQDQCSGILLVHLAKHSRIDTVPVKAMVSERLVSLIASVYLIAYLRKCLVPLLASDYVVKDDCG